MDPLLEIIGPHLDYAPFIIFGLFMLAGLNVPISEDAMIIVSGMLASTALPDRGMELFIAVFLGAFLSDWESYWLGRYFGPRLMKLRWFSGQMPRKRVRQIQRFYAKYGLWTLFVGRFIPFGVRNCLFMTAGLGRMSFGRFIIADGLACLISNTVLFCLAYSFGCQCNVVYAWVTAFNRVVMGLFLLGMLVMVGSYWFRRRSMKAEECREVQ